MAVSTTHSVTAGDVTRQLPVKSSRIGAATEPVSTTDLEDWIAEGAGQANAILSRHGIDPTTLGADEAETVRAGIIAYAAAKTLQSMGAPSDVTSRFWETWGSVRKTLRESPQDLGDAQKSTDAIKSNIDPTDPTEKNWDTSGFGGW